MQAWLMLFWLNSQVEVVDEKLMRQFSSSALGSLPPLSAAVGGVVAQEALISLTGKFSPLQQWVRVWSRDYHMTVM